MSAVESTAVEVSRWTGEPRYLFYRSRPLNVWIVSDTVGEYRGAPYKLVDAVQSKAAAERATRLLNAGAARVDCHAVLGCKVVER